MKKVVLNINIQNKDDCLELSKHINKELKIKRTYIDCQNKTLTVYYQKNLNIDKLERIIEEKGYQVLGINFNKRISNITNIWVALLMIMVVSAIGIKLYQKSIPIDMANTLLITCAFIGILLSIKIIIFSISKLLKKEPSKEIILILIILNLFMLSLFTKNSNFYEVTIFLILILHINHICSIKKENVINTRIKEITDSNYLKTANNSIIGDSLICLPGDKFLTDGIILNGKTHINESHLTGISHQTEKSINDNVLQGSINYENKITYQVIRENNNSYIEEIAKEMLIVKNNNKEKDNILPILLLTVMCSIITFLISYLMNNSINDSLNNYSYFYLAIIPLSILYLGHITDKEIIFKMLKRGIILKHISSLKTVLKSKKVVFDKTGTITNGYLGIDRIINHSEVDNDELLSVIASIEKDSISALGIELTKYLKSIKVKAKYDLSTEDIAGYGVRAKDKDTEAIYYACNSELLKKLDVINPYQEEEQLLIQEGNKVIYLVENNKILAIFALKDIIKQESKKVLDFIKNNNKKIDLITGDNEVTTSKITKELEFNKVTVGLNANDKAKLIRSLKKKEKVLMVGDGVNDSIALAEANISIALKSDSAITSYAADIIVNNLSKIIDIYQTASKNKKVNRLCNMISILFSIGILTALIFDVQYKGIFIILILIINLIIIYYLKKSVVSK